MPDRRQKGEKDEEEPCNKKVKKAEVKEVKNIFNRFSCLENNDTNPKTKNNNTKMTDNITTKKTNNNNVKNNTKTTESPSSLGYPPKQNDHPLPNTPPLLLQETPPSSIDLQSHDSKEAEEETEMQEMAQVPEIVLDMTCESETNDVIPFQHFSQSLKAYKKRLINGLILCYFNKFFRGIVSTND